MHKLRPIFSGFGKPGENVSEKNGTYILIGKGTDLGCNLLIQEEIANPSMLELDIRGEIVKELPWTRLRIEIFDKDKPDEPATSFENEYLTVDLDPDNFRRLSLPVLGIVKSPQKVQFMVVGPAESRLEIRNVTLR
jgi:hypothetical protein